ncbi:MAG: hypothetical protein OIF57_17105 [Marinobacterium sp.]|nr:hypothetical protein [Marinobacterium sp.]
MGTYMYEQSLVRACVETGGSFDYIEQFCDMNTTQPFIPLMVRQPLLVNGGMLLSSLGLLLCLFGLYVRPGQGR